MELSKLILGRTSIQETQHTQSSKGVKVGTDENDAMEEEIGNQQDSVGMRYLQVTEQNVMQSPRAEKPKQMTRGGGKWKRLSRDIQE